MHSSEDLICHVSDLADSEGHVVVLLQEVVCAQPQQFEHDADVTVVIKPVQHSHTRTKKIIFYIIFFFFYDKLFLLQ